MRDFINMPRILEQIGDNWTDGCYTLQMTCSACPEQYDMLDPEGNTVGYFRLRHGTFSVDYPDCGDYTTLVGNPQGDGLFEDHEREYWLTLGYLSIIKEIQKERSDES